MWESNKVTKTIYNKLYRREMSSPLRRQFNRGFRHLTEYLLNKRDKVFLLPLFGIEKQHSL